MKTKENEGIDLDGMISELKLAEPNPDTTPMFDDFFPVIKAANANVVVTDKGRKMFITLEELEPKYKEIGTLPAAGLLAHAAIYGEEVEGVDPKQQSVALVARNFTKEEAFAPVKGK